MVSGIDLEQREHRGIAVYSKALLRALSEAGAEVWVLTEFSADLTEVALQRLPASTRSVVQLAKLLDALLRGRPTRALLSLRRQLIRRLPLGRWLLTRWDRERELFRQLCPRRTYRRSDLVALTVHDLIDNPYLQHERLGYLQWVHGLISARDVYLHSMRLAGQRQGQSLTIDLTDFDGFISTCPLNIQARGVAFTLQTVHDLIPLEFVQTSDRPAIFARRLACCADTSRLFMSASTAMKFRSAMGQGRGPHEAVVVQPPSLRFPPQQLECDAAPRVLRPMVQGQRKPLPLKPFRYLLFNSSLEPRKNLLYALKAWRESDLARQGILFCVAGSLKGDAYSDAVRQWVRHDPHVLLTDFVDESMRRDLFLNALALVSPSLVEGFGIPVLDAACLGLVVLASPSASHREIQNLHDFRDYVWLCDNLDCSQLAAAMRLVVKHEQAIPLDDTERRRQRLQRYHRIQQQLERAFRRDVVGLIRQSLPVPQASGPAKGSCSQG